MLSIITPMLLFPPVALSLGQVLLTLLGVVLIFLCI